MWTLHFSLALSRSYTHPMTDDEENTEHQLTQCRKKNLAPPRFLSVSPRGGPAPYVPTPVQTAGAFMLMEEIRVLQFSCHINSQTCDITDTVTDSNDHKRLYS